MKTMLRILLILTGVIVLREEAKGASVDPNAIYAVRVTATVNTASLNVVSGRIKLYHPVVE